MNKEDISKIIFILTFESIIKDMKELDDFRLLIFSEHDNSFNNIYEFLDSSELFPI